MVAIALRNVRRHAAHALLLGGLFALASFLFIAGNSMLLHSNRVLRRLFVGTITGDFVIAAKSEESLSIFGANTPAIGEFIHIPLLIQRDELSDAVLGLPDIEKVTPLVTGIALMDVNGRRRTVPVFGIEPDTYFSLLEDVEITDGRALRENERGVMLTESHLKRITRETGSPVEFGDEILFTSGAGMRFRIRPVPLVGVFRYPVSMEYVDQIALLDGDTLRALNSIQHRIVTSLPKDGKTAGPASAADVDSLFDGMSADDETDEQADDGPTGFTVDDVLDRVHTDRGDEEEPVDGSAHFLLVRGRDSEALHNIADRYDAEVLSWRQAAGQSALLALLLQILFNGGFTLFVLAIALGSVNIIFISTYRRMREIGTLRAIGAEDRIVLSIFIVEHAFIGIIGWLAGLIAACGFSALFAAKRITVDNRLIAMLLGGQRITVPLDPGTVFICLAVVICLVGVTVSIPLSRAMRKPIVLSIRETG